jgi:hypothetical protein
MDQVRRGPACMLQRRFGSAADEALDGMHDACPTGFRGVSSTQAQCTWSAPM